MNKAVLSAAVRRVGLLGVAYRVAFILDACRNYPRNRRFRQEHPDFGFPPRRFLFQTADTTQYENYYDGGRQLARFVGKLATNATPPGVRRICEWGSGAGKNVRHLHEVDPGFDVYGTDYDEQLIRWCSANIPNVTFRLNDLEPPLPFAANHFDMLFSFSVFTHLPPDLQSRWLAEQLRAVRSGGLVLLTVHGDTYRHRLTPDEVEQYETGGVVVHGGTDAGATYFTTFNSPRYMEEQLLRGCDIVYRQTDVPTTQDVWVIRKP